MQGIKFKMAKLKVEELEVWRKFHKRGGHNLSRCKVDQINLDQSNSKKHNLKVLDICRELYSKGHHFITEAVSNKIKNRRYDVVDISELGGKIIEIEVTGKQKPDADVTYILEKGKWIIYS